MGCGESKHDVVSGNTISQSKRSSASTTNRDGQEIVPKSEANGLKSEPKESTEISNSKVESENGGGKKANAKSEGEIVEVSGDEKADQVFAKLPGPEKVNGVVEIGKSKSEGGIAAAEEIVDENAGKVFEKLPEPEIENGGNMDQSKVEIDQNKEIKGKIDEEISTQNEEQSKLKDESAIEAEAAVSEKKNGGAIEVKGGEGLPIIEGKDSTIVIEEKSASSIEDRETETPIEAPKAT